MPLLQLYFLPPPVPGGAGNTWPERPLTGAGYGLSRLLPVCLWLLSLRAGAIATRVGASPASSATCLARSALACPALPCPARSPSPPADALVSLPPAVASARAALVWRPRGGSSEERTPPRCCRRDGRQWLLSCGSGVGTLVPAVVPALTSPGREARLWAGSAGEALCECQL